MASMLFMLVLICSHVEFPASAHASTSGVDDCKNGVCTAQIEIDDATAMIQSKAKISLDGQISKEDVTLLTKFAGVGHLLEVGGSERLAAAQKMESSMETAVTKMIDGRGRALPEEILTMIAKEMEELRGRLVAEKNGFQTQINNANDVLANCNTNMQTTFGGGVATAKGIVDSDYMTHHACRGAELSAYDVKTASCDLLASKTKEVADAAPNCNCQFSGSYTTSDVLTCLENNKNWRNWHENNLTKQQSDCNTKTDIWTIKADACDTNQSNYEVAVCLYAEKLENMCSTLDTCYNDAYASRTSTKETVKTEEKHLKAVLASAKKIVCYLSILNKSTTKKFTTRHVLDTCKKNMSVFTDKTYLSTSVNDMNITILPPDEKEPCQTLKSTPGDGQWAAEEYAKYKKEWLRETAVCSHKTTTTTTTKACVSADAVGVQWHKIWSYHGGSGGITVFRPSKPGYCSLGDIIVKQKTSTIPAGTKASFLANGVGAAPKGFKWKVAENQAGGINYFEPVCPEGFIALGHVGVQSPESSKTNYPPNDSVCCAPSTMGTLTTGTTGYTDRLWSDPGTGGMDNGQFKRLGLETFVADPCFRCSGNNPSLPYYALASDNTCQA